MSASFHGRARELERLDALFARGARLVTLLGPGGTGKTRLATRYLESRRAPSVFCDLGEVQGSDGIAGAIARVLEVPLGARSGDDAVDQLADVLSSRGAPLLVLDDAEHVVEPLSRMVARILDRAKEARVLVTSRELLRVAGEAVLEVPPLDRDDGIALFVERAAQVRRGYAPDHDALLLVAEIVGQLDALPLAIELAAPRMLVMDEAELLRRLPQRLDLLGRRGARERQRTLRAAIEWSWRWLGAWERSALAQCAVFRGGFTLDAAEAVLDLSAHADAPSMVDVLQALHEKSLLRSMVHPSRPRDVRFGLYESIRTFAWERLEEEGAARGAIARHAAHYLSRGEAWASGVPRHGGSDALRRLEADLENVVAVHARAEDADTALRAVLAVEPLLAARGPYETFVAMLDDALARHGGDRALRARTLVVRARARTARGRLEDCRSDLDAALSLAREAGDAFAEGRAIANRALVVSHGGSWEQARADLEAALPILRRAGDADGEHIALGNLANVLRDVGRMEEAREAYERAAAIARDIGHRRYEGFHVGNLGGLLHWQGRLREARALHEDALAILRDAGDKRFTAFFAGNLGVVLQELGDFDAARAREAEAITLAREVGERRLHAGFVGYLAGIEHESGRLEEARARYREALDLFGATSDRRHEALVLAALGALEAALGMPSEAERRLDAASARLRELGDELRLSAVELHRGHVDLARGRESNDLTHVARAAERLRTVRPDHLARNDDVRFAQRLLERAVAAAAQARTLRIDRDGAWFEIDGARVDLGRRKSARLLLVALALHHARARGAALDAPSLVAAGWPGERMKAEAGANRVRVTLTLLRQLGLRDVLLTRDDGYLLDPKVEIALER